MTSEIRKPQSFETNLILSRTSNSWITISGNVITSNPGGAMPPSISGPFLFVASAYTAHCLGPPKDWRVKTIVVLNGKCIPEPIPSVATHTKIKAEVSSTQNEKYSKSLYSPKCCCWVMSFSWRATLSEISDMDTMYIRHPFLEES